MSHRREKLPAEKCPSKKLPKEVRTHPEAGAGSHSSEKRPAEKCPSKKLSKEVLAHPEVGARGHQESVRKLFEEWVPSINTDKIFNEGDSDYEQEFSDNEEESIRTQFSSVTGEDMDEMLNNWLKYVPEEYPDTLHGFADGCVGALKAELANCLIHVDGLGKRMAKVKVEYNDYLKLARSCKDYIINKLEVQEACHMDDKRAWEREREELRKKHEEELQEKNKEILELRLQLESTAL